MAASGHAVIYKRDARASVAWVGFIWFVPFLGALLYLLLGINRIRRRAQALRRAERVLDARLSSFACGPTEVEQHLSSSALDPLVTLVGRVVHEPLARGNQVELLVDGDQAFPAMLEAIEGAKQSVALSSYIFDNDDAGRRFAQALEAAHRRGVAVRVLIDDVGRRYSLPSISRRLTRAGVRVAHFLPSYLPLLPYMNLRNHGKVLVVDGHVAFTGGMNIRQGNLLATHPRHPIRDLQARIHGPVVGHLLHAFMHDWFFTTKEILEGDRWFPALEARGPVIARGVPDGPDENFEVLRLTLLGALSVAKQSVGIVTPYFVPDSALITALEVAAMRGVAVDIVLPEKNNLWLVQWASMAMIWQVLRRGCRVWLTPPPFDHTKLMVVDDVWTLLGSANWDARSLRLNFELNVECYDRDLAAHATELIRERITRARPLTLEAADSRSLPVRLRDGLARLFSPYL